MKNIIIIGMKACGKSTVGRHLAQSLHMHFVELDEQVEALHQEKNGERLSCREIFRTHGEAYFRLLETEALKTQMHQKNIVLACGGGTPLVVGNQKILQSLGTVVFLDTDPDMLLLRILKTGIPAFFADQDQPKKSLHLLLAKRNPIYKKLAQMQIAIHLETPTETVSRIMERINI